MIAEISYFDGWLHWWDGVDVDEDYPAGSRIETWGRIGKIATAVSGYVILLITGARLDVLPG
ncbi:hypothetical protein [Nocardia vaccinii]|uniref:hypothetical protein n=1 Tax=Nocardia vaccinii TaxID=1822 RepID=UPI0008324610|nr:hypothetical protein [Nocardia vaccinii]